jgi:hypothetical protein
MGGVKNGGVSQSKSNNVWAQSTVCTTVYTFSPLTVSPS